MRRVLHKMHLLAVLGLLPFIGYAQQGEDFTSNLKAADMSDVSGGETALTLWNNSGFKVSSKGDNYAPMFGGQFIEQWKASTETSLAYLDDISLSQTLTELPDGHYLFSAACIACQQGDGSEVTGTYLYANDAMENVSTGNGVPERIYVAVEVIDGSLTVGFKTSGTTANWIAWDNAQLYYYADGLDKELAIACLDLRDVITKAESYPDTVKVQAATYNTLTESLNVARDLLDSGASSVEAVLEVMINLEEAINAVDASIAAYASLNTAIADAKVVYDAHLQNEELVGLVSALYSTIEDAITVFDMAEADTTGVYAQIASLNEISSKVLVDAQIYTLADSISEICYNCEPGNSYGQFPQVWIDRMFELQTTLSDLMDEYDEGTLSATEFLPKLDEIWATIANFWNAMVTIDFTLPLNSRLFPYDASIDEEANAHNDLFMGNGVWSFGLLSGGNIEEWNIDNAGCDTGYSEDGKGTANDVLTWHDAASTSWLYIRNDGLFHPLAATPPVAIFTASQDGVYIFHSTISSQDANRVSKNRGDLRSYAYYVQNGATNVSQITDFVSYNNNTAPANFQFYANLKAGDKIAVTLGDCRHNGNGNALSKIDTLYVLGNKGEENLYTKADAEASGLLFFNPYTPAEDFSVLPPAIEEGKEVLTAMADKIGTGFAMVDSAAYANLDSIVKVAENMYAVELASQPEVNQMVITIKDYIDALYASAGFGVCLGSDVIPSDTLLNLTDSQFLADGLYYIQDAITGDYVTAPGGGNKVATPISPLIDSTFTQQNAQVWHIGYDETNGVYGIATRKNDGQTWTLEEEAEAGDGNAETNPYYHIKENMQCVYGTVYNVYLTDNVLWHGFRIFYNGTNYCIVGGTGGFTSGWTNVMLPGGTTIGRGVKSAYNFGWNLIPFKAQDTPDGIENTASAPVVSVEYYNVMGMKIDKTEQGVVIKREIRADGSITAVKMLVK